MMKNIKAPLSHILNISMLNGSARDNFSPQGTFEMSGNILGCQNWWEGVLLTSMGRDAAQHPTVHRTALTTESYPAQNITNPG